MHQPRGSTRLPACLPLRVKPVAQAVTAGAGEIAVGCWLHGAKGLLLLWAAMERPQLLEQPWARWAGREHGWRLLRASLQSSPKRQHG